MGLFVRHRHNRAVGVLAGLALAGVLLSCRSGSAPAPPRSPAAASVVVASFNFPESELLAEIYAQALEGAGVPVDRELDLGPREMVLPAVREGQVDVVPEYLGSALAAVEPGVDERGHTTAELRAQLSQQLTPWGVQVLSPARAQNQNGFAVTAAVAARLRLAKVSDLARVAGSLTLGGPSECPQRPLCGVGLVGAYGVRFGRFLPFDEEQQRVAALEQQVVDVAVMFTTDGALAPGSLRLLIDDRTLQPPENVVPLVSARALARYGSRITDTLDAVSSRLTTSGLVFLNWRVSIGGKAVASEARGWLQRQRLPTRT